MLKVQFTAAKYPTQHNTTDSVCLSSPLYKMGLLTQYYQRVILY